MHFFFTQERYFLTILYLHMHIFFSLIFFTGTGKGKYYTANVPFQSGTSDKTYLRVFHSVIKVIRETYQPQCLVVQCGADSLASKYLSVFLPSSYTILIEKIQKCFLFSTFFRFMQNLFGTL